MIKRWLAACLAFVVFWPSSVAAEDLAGLYDRALNLSQSGDFVQALPLWDQVLEQAPNDAAALSNRGNVRLGLGDPQGAIADQTLSMELAPEEADPHLNRGTAEEALKDWSAAAADYLSINSRRDFSFDSPAKHTS